MATDGLAAEIVGRQAELALLDSHLGAVMAGHPRLVCVEGAAGIGKTTLLKAFREAHSEVQHLVVSGEERESVLALGVIDQVYRRLSKADRRTQLPIMSLGAPVPDAFMVGLSLLEVLGELDDDSPVVLTIEDAQWADANSLQAIAFAFRRMAADRVMVLFTVRAGHLGAVPQALHQLLATESGVHLTLSGLETAEVRLLAERQGFDLSGTSVERLRAYTEGNPLYIGALLREVGVASIAGQDHLPPAPQSFTETVRAKLDRGSSGLRALIEAAAVLGVRSRLDQLIQMTAIGEPFQVLDEAAAAGLLQFRGTPPRLDITFTHPLVAAAAYHGIPLDSRARLHKLASSVVDEELIALRHRLAASTGPNPELAREFEAYGISQIATNSWTNAATALLSAADLTDSRANRERCVLDAIDCELLAGELKSGHDLTHFEPTARRSYVMARTFLSRGQPFEAEPLYKSAWELAAGMSKRDPELEVRIASWYASLLLNAGRPSEAIEWATRALSALPEERRPTAFATTIQLMSLACRGDAGSVDRLVGSLTSNPALVSIEGFELLLSRGVARMWSDRVAEARGDLARAAELARQRGATHLLVPTLMHLADAESRLGDFDAAVTHAELAVSAAHESDQLFLAPAAHAVAAYPYICRGAWSVAERHLEQAQEIALIVGDLLSVGYAAIASARLALMRQRWEDAATALSPLLAIQLEPTNEPGLVAWQLF